MSQSLPYHAVKFDTNKNSEDKVTTPDDNDFCFFLEVEMPYPDIIREKTKNFSFWSENEIISLNVVNE